MISMGDDDITLEGFDRKLSDTTKEFRIVLAFALARKPLSATKLTELKRKMTKDEREYLKLKWI